MTNKEIADNLRNATLWCIGGRSSTRKNRVYFAAQMAIAGLVPPAWVLATKPDPTGVSTHSEWTAWCAGELFFLTYTWETAGPGMSGWRVTCSGSSYFPESGHRTSAAAVAEMQEALALEAEGSPSNEAAHHRANAAKLLPQVTP